MKQKLPVLHFLKREYFLGLPSRGQLHDYDNQDTTIAEILSIKNTQAITEVPKSK